MSVRSGIMGRVTPRRVGLAVGVLCLAALAEINGEALRLMPLLEAHQQAQMALLAAGVLLVSWGLGGRLMPRGGSNPRRAEMAALAVIMLAGAAVRVWNVQGTVHFYLDEGSFIEGILDLQNMAHVKILSPFNYIANFTWVYPYMQVVGVDALGANLLGIRAPSLALGVLTIPALWLLARTLFDGRTALIAAALLAAFPPHIHFSRLGLNNIADPLFGVLALAFIARGLKGEGRVNYALGGVLLGLTQYFYEGGKLVYPALALLWLPLAALAWRGGWRGLGLAGLAAALVAAPVYYTLALWRLPVAMRLGHQGMDRQFWMRVLLSPPGEGHLRYYLEHRLLPPLQHFFMLPDHSRFYYGGDTALVLPLMLPFLAAGLGLALWRRPVAGGLLALWLLLTAFGNSLLIDTHWSARFVVAFPALALLLAVGVNGLLRLLERAPDWGGQRRAAGALLVALLGVAQVAYYFGPHLALYNVQIRPHHDQQDVLFRARDFPPGTNTYIISDDPDIWLLTLHTLADHWGIDIKVQHFYTPDMLRFNQLDRLPREGDFAFFVEQTDWATQALLRQKFGPAEGTLSPYNVPLTKQFMLFYYERSAVEAWRARAGE